LGAQTNRIHATKQWLNIDGRTGLVEQVPLKLQQTALEELPPPPTNHALLQQSPDSILHRVADRLLLPHLKFAAKATTPMRVASSLSRSKGVALDYTTLSSQSGYTLEAGTTYYVSGNVVLSGTTVIEPCV